eukprot:m51a1_g11937 putative protein-tyrosine kinase 6 (741) ;mRNA; f:717332-719679
MSAEGSREQQSGASLAEILRSLSLDRLEPVFARECVDVFAVPLLLPDDWKALGVALGPRKLIQHAVSRLPRPSRPATPPGAGETVGAFLASLGLGALEQSFLDEEVDMRSLLLLDEAELATLGVKLGPRRVIQSEIARRRSPGRVAGGRVRLSSSGDGSDGQKEGQRPPRCRSLRMLQVRKGTKIGSGFFGSVWRGMWAGTTAVALKALDRPRDEGSDSPEYPEAGQDWSEAAVLSTLRHPNVLQFYGLASIDGVLHIVMELADGSVLDLLRAAPPGAVPGRSLQSMALSCAAGMAYLASEHIVHRDLATRNLLFFVSSDGTHTIKVADFGLARVVDSDSGGYVSSNYVCPLKWTAPEALAFHRFSPASDVWSFGIVLWELWSGGQDPYTGIDRNGVFAMLSRGERLPRPERCPSCVFEVMMSCWASEPAQRPAFPDLWERLCALDPDRPDAEVGHETPRSLQPEKAAYNPETRYTYNISQSQAPTSSVQLDGYKSLSSVPQSSLRVHVPPPVAPSAAPAPAAACSRSMPASESAAESAAGPAFRGMANIPSPPSPKRKSAGASLTRSMGGGFIGALRGLVSAPLSSSRSVSDLALGVNPPSAKKKAVSPRDMATLRTSESAFKELRLRVGNEHRVVDPVKMNPLSNNRHTWRVFVEGDGVRDCIESVKFQLHPTFFPSVVTKTEGPFELVRCGWGTFSLPITIVFKQDVFAHEPITWTHRLSFDGPGAYTELIITPPSD